VSRAAALALHERLLAEHGDPPGAIDEERLEAALAAPQHHHAHEQGDLSDLAAAYASALVRNHTFRDGNKRLALTVAGVFLELNGHRLEAAEGDAVGAILALVTRKLEPAGFAEWLRRSSVKM
jgi:death-on-curing protein